MSSGGPGTAANVDGDLDDHSIAAVLAEAAGRRLLEIRSGSLSGKELGAEGDRQAHALLMDALGRARPGDAVLSEEGVDDDRRLLAGRVWIVDPLDGTREYSEPGRSDWAVHVALWEEGQLAAGAVALPALTVVLRADRPEVVAVPMPDHPRLVVSRSRPPAIAEHVAEALGMRLVPMGSAGAKVGAILAGRADAYLHTGGQYEWDSAAPVAVALGAGLHASRVDGSPLHYNQPDPALPDLLVCRPDLAPHILRAVKVHGGANNTARTA